MNESQTASEVPLAVDLDGTLILTDTTWEGILRLAKCNPFRLLVLPFWLLRGRAYLKRKVASKVNLDPAALPYNRPFVSWLKEQKNSGRHLVLATASDRAVADLIARHVGIFDEVLASDGVTNLRDEKKLDALINRFGRKGFDYAGNSSADLAVWAGARSAIVVNASKSLEQRAVRLTQVSRVFGRNRRSGKGMFTEGNEGNKENGA